MVIGFKSMVGVLGALPGRRCSGRNEPYATESRPWHQMSETHDDRVRILIMQQIQTENAMRFGEGVTWTMGRKTLDIGSTPCCGRLLVPKTWHLANWVLGKPERDGGVVVHGRSNDLGQYCAALAG